jgi:serine/threonine protein kinase
MLSGDPPFNADSAMSLLMRHLNDPVPDLGAKRTGIPPELIRIVNKSLEKDRERRYRSASEMAEDLKRLLASLEVGSASTTSAIPQADSAITEAQTTVDRIEEKTEAWNVSAPSLEPSGPVIPKPETFREEPKRTKPAMQASLSPLVKFGGAGIVGILLLVAGWFAFRNISSPAANEPTSIPTSIPAATRAASTATITLLTDTSVPPPTDEPTATIEPTATNTLPPLYVRINNITVNASSFYVVEYETFGYTEQLPGQHIHFFFNTVPVEQAGMPGSGPWKLYGGPRPFDGYRVGDKPAAATQMCALVANPDHSVILGSGNCFDLPE